MKPIGWTTLLLTFYVLTFLPVTLHTIYYYVTLFFVGK